MAHARERDDGRGGAHPPARRAAHGERWPVPANVRPRAVRRAARGAPARLGMGAHLRAARALARSSWRSLVVAVLAVVAGRTVYDYFALTDESFEMRFVYPYQVDAASQYIDGLPPGTYVYFFSDRWSFDYETRRFLAPDATGEDRSREFPYEPRRRCPPELQRQGERRRRVRVARPLRRRRERSREALSGWRADRAAPRGRSRVPRVLRASMMLRRRLAKVGRRCGSLAPRCGAVVAAAERDRERERRPFARRATLRGSRRRARARSRARSSAPGRRRALRLRRCCGRSGRIRAAAPRARCRRRCPDTKNSAKPPPGSVAPADTRPPRGVCRNALSSRLPSTCSMRSKSATTLTSPAPPRRRAQRRTPRRGLRTHPAVRQQLRDADLAEVHRLLSGLDARKVEQLADEVQQPPRLRIDDAGGARRAPPGCRACRRASPARSRGSM